MARVFENPKRICEVLTCKSKWIKGNWHETLRISSREIPLAQRYHSHCLIGAMRCTMPAPRDTKKDLTYSDEWYTQAQVILRRDIRTEHILKIINKLASQGKFPLRHYPSPENFNDHPTTQWKHIQLLLRHLPKGV